MTVHHDRFTGMVGWLDITRRRIDIERVRPEGPYGAPRRNACVKCPFSLRSALFGACCTAIRDEQGMPMNSLGLRRTGRCPA